MIKFQEPKMVIIKNKEELEQIQKKEQNNRRNK